MTGEAVATARDLLARLIAFDTTSHRSNLALVNDVCAYLDDHGVTAALSYDASGRKANILATIGPIDVPGVVLSAHTDVVPVDGQTWSSDPFALREADGRLYGRGTVDMKGFVACILAMVPVLRRAALKRPFHIALSCDEEIGCKGVPILLDQIEAELPRRPMGCLVGEPTRMALIDGHKGKGGWRVSVRGQAGHSSQPERGLNAIERAAWLITWLGRLQQRYREDGPFAQGFDPPHVTLNLGRIEGGTQLNVVAEHCMFEFEARTVPGLAPDEVLGRLRTLCDDEILPAMRARAAEAAIGFEEIVAYPGLGGDGSSAFERLMRKLTATDSPGKVAFGTEAGHYAARGIPAVVCGPGDIARAHRPDEHIEIGELAACLDLLERLMAEAAA